LAINAPDEAGIYPNAQESRNVSSCILADPSSPSTKLSACDDRAKLNAAAISGLNIATRAHVPATRHGTFSGEARVLNRQTVVIAKALDWNHDGVTLASGATATRCRSS
jgi:hypothetical protein